MVAPKNSELFKLELVILELSMLEYENFTFSIFAPLKFVLEIFANLKTELDKVEFSKLTSVKFAKMKLEFERF